LCFGNRITDDEALLDWLKNLISLVSRRIWWVVLFAFANPNDRCRDSNYTWLVILLLMLCDSLLKSA